MKIIDVPTGKIIQCAGERGGRPLECLFVADYGRKRNCKARFLGLHDDIHGVPNGDPMPLSEKMVITVSSQYGCSMGCKFCDVPKVGPGINATTDDLLLQVKAALAASPASHTKRLNIHFARMGEPTFNPYVLSAAYFLRVSMNGYCTAETVHPVVSTMMPRHNDGLFRFLKEWVHLKNVLYWGEAGLQFSINTTDEAARYDMFNKHALSLREISQMVSALAAPRGRKYALNFAINSDTVIDPELLVRLFPVDRFMVKLTPLHHTDACTENGFKVEGYDAFDIYRKHEQALVDVGFDVLVFVPSEEEERGRITCGNAILAHNKEGHCNDEER